MKRPHPLVLVLGTLGAIAPGIASRDPLDAVIGGIINGACWVLIAELILWVIARVRRVDPQSDGPPGAEAASATESNDGAHRDSDSKAALRPPHGPRAFPTKVLAATFVIAIVGGGLAYMIQAESDKDDLRTEIEELNESLDDSQDARSYDGRQISRLNKRVQELLTNGASTNQRFLVCRQAVIDYDAGHLPTAADWHKCVNG